MLLSSISSLAEGIKDSKDLSCNENNSTLAYCYYSAYTQTNSGEFIEINLKPCFSLKKRKSKKKFPHVNLREIYSYVNIEKKRNRISFRRILMNKNFQFR